MICKYCEERECRVVQIVPVRPGWRAAYDVTDVPEEAKVADGDKGYVAFPVDLWGLWSCGHVTAIYMNGDGGNVAEQFMNFLTLIPPGIVEGEERSLVKEWRRANDPPSASD